MTTTVMCPIPTVDRRTNIDELAEIARQEHELAVGRSADAVGHAIKCGEALYRVRAMLPRGEWGRWLTDNFPHTPYTARNYIRLFEHQEDVINEGCTTIEGARKLLAGVRPKGRLNEDQIAEIKELFDAGVPRREIAKRFGVDAQTVKYWADPKSRKNQIRQRARWRQKQRKARALLERKEKDEYVKSHGGTIADGYSSLRKAAQHLDRAIEETDNRDTKDAIKAALATVHQAEDEIIKALKQERTLNG